MTAQRRTTQGSFIPAGADEHATGPMNAPLPSESTDPAKIGKASEKKKQAAKKPPAKGRGSRRSKKK